MKSLFKLLLVTLLVTFTTTATTQEPFDPQTTHYRIVSCIDCNIDSNNDGEFVQGEDKMDSLFLTANYNGFEQYLDTVTMVLGDSLQFSWNELYYGDNSAGNNVGLGIEKLHLRHIATNTFDYEERNWNWGDTVAMTPTNIGLHRLKFTFTSNIFVYINIIDPSDATSGTASLFDNEIDEVEFNLYPNPTTDIINISFDNDGKDTQINIYSLSGQLISTNTNDSFGAVNEQIYVNDMTSGVYLIQVGNTTKKFIKQ